MDGPRQEDRLPAYSFLDVVVLGDGQVDAATQTAAFQYFATISGCHSGAEAMDSNTAADFWLISPFGTH
jgi:hypothetical protein